MGCITLPCMKRLVFQALGINLQTTPEGITKRVVMEKRIMYRISSTYELGHVKTDRCKKVTSGSQNQMRK